MREREALIRRYFNCWVENDPAPLPEIFTEDVHYIESYGPGYHGLWQIERWFHDWNLRGCVLRWDCHRFLHSGGTCAVEWTFSCDYDGKSDTFDGVSLIEFQDGKIAWLKEFASTLPNHYPYDA
ncbi:nuclear transport factor 2 family protein [Oscillospiraceae bacterium OttesenSCG-928-F05]|nr:nuclear transport factor 2 family protein [Oscillospiraceae bacterium OttesenSCG-928-F05]